MSIYPNLNNEPVLLKTKTKDDQIEELQYKMEKHDHEIILKSFKIDNEFYRKKYKNLNRKKVLLIITETFLVRRSTSTMSLFNPSIFIVFPSSTAFLTSTAILITIQYMSKSKIRFTKLRDWINVITLLFEKTLKESMIERKIDQKETEQLKRIYTLYNDKGKEILNSTKFKVEVIIGDIISKDLISPEQVTKPNKS